LAAAAEAIAAIVPSPFATASAAAAVELTPSYILVCCLIAVTALWTEKSNAVFGRHSAREPQNN
jgi:hypothetical protein